MPQISVYLGAKEKRELLRRLNALSQLDDTKYTGKSRSSICKLLIQDQLAEVEKTYSPHGTGRGHT